MTLSSLARILCSPSAAVRLNEGNGDDPLEGTPKRRRIADSASPLRLAPAVNGRRPPRIDGFDYTGPHAYFLTLCTLNRVPWFSDQPRAGSVVAELLRTTTAYGFELIAYCLMPDHLHALAEGARPDSNFLKCVAMFKQRTAFAHTRGGRGRLWQEGFFEHVIRREEDLHRGLHRREPDPPGSAEAHRVSTPGLESLHGAATHRGGQAIPRWSDTRP
jgi:REP element-mobilizing transposase RayT